MSQGLLVGVIAAVLGLFGAVLGAVVTARATRAGAQANAEAALEQVRGQANAEHAQWLRQQRLNAYDGFLEAWDEFTRTMRAEQGTRETALSVVAGRTVERAQRVALLGPDEVAQAAEDLAKVAWQDVDAIVSYVKSSRSFRRNSDIPAVRDIEAPIDALLGDMDRMRELIAAAGEDVAGLEEDPQVIAIMQQADKDMESVESGMRKLEERADLLSTIGEKATEMSAVVEANATVRARSRARFVTEARRALGALPQ